MKNKPTEARVVDELLEGMLTTEEKLALYGVATLIKTRTAEVVPTEPVDGAVWPARPECETEELSSPADSPRRRIPALLVLFARPAVNYR
jgi:hypothetical protein